ncbi:testis-expressed protein 44 [Hipposideros larvatus]
MTTVPSGKARASSIATHDDNRSSDSPTVGSQSQVSLLADVPVADGAAVSAEWQDVNQASIKPATSESMSVSGDKDKYEDDAEHSQEPKETKIRFAHSAPDALQTSKSLQCPMWERPVQDSRKTQSLPTFQYDSLVKEKIIPLAVGVLDSKEELAPSTPNAEVRSPQNESTVSTADADSQLDTQATGITEAVEKEPENPEALFPDTEALLSAEPQVVTEGDLVDHSGDLQAQPVPPSPGGSAHHSPGSPTVALMRTPLDCSLYMPSEENDYMRSMTSMLNWGEGSISSLADILVWSEANMGVATGLLAFGHSSVSELLHSTGPRLRCVTSILGNARLAFSSRLAAGTDSALRSVTHMLERMEQRTVDGIHSAVRYLTSHLTPHHTGVNCD